MILALIPANETQRLDAVHKMEILDTPPDVTLDRITRIACQVFDVASAFITLVDQDRVWFKAMSGAMFVRNHVMFLFVVIR